MHSAPSHDSKLKMPTTRGGSASRYQDTNIQDTSVQDTNVQYMNDQDTNVEDES